MQVDTTQFKARHGRQPRGFGRWGFQVGEKTAFVVGQFSDAKKKAFKVAQDQGEERVIVLPGKELVPQRGNPERPEQLTQDQIDLTRESLMVQAETRKFYNRTRTVIPVKGMKAAELMVIFDIQSKRTAHAIVKRGFYIFDYTKPAMCPGEIDIEEAYRITKWYFYKKFGGRVSCWADADDMIQDAVTRLIERGGDPRMAEASYRFYVVRGAMAEYLRRNQKHQHEDEEKIDVLGSRWGTWDRSFRPTETMCQMIEARGITPLERAA